MADPRFYDNRGPFALDDLCASASLVRPQGADGKARIFDVAGLAAAGPPHLSFYDHVRAHRQFTATAAGWCLVGERDLRGTAPKSVVLIPCASIGRAFAAVARLFYPERFPGFDLEVEGNTVFKEFYGVDDAFTALDKVLGCHEWFRK